MSFISNLINKPTKTVAIEEVTHEESIDVTSGEWFTSKEHYLEFTAAFKNWINRGGHADSTHFLLYAILRNKDWNKGWTYPLNPGKQTEQHWKKMYAFQKITSPYNEKELLAPFDGTVTTEMLKTLRENLEYIRKGPFGTLRGDK